MMANMKREALKAVLDPDLAAWVRKEAHERRCSIAQVFRDLVIAEIQRRKEDSPSA